MTPEELDGYTAQMMTRTFRPLVTHFTLAFALAIPSTSWADSTAEAFVKEKQAELSTLTKGNASANRERIERTLDDLFDYEAFARASLHEHWDARSSEERADFQAVMKELVTRAYRKNVFKTANRDVQFTGQVARDSGLAVKSVANDRGNGREKPVEVEYFVQRAGEQWHVQDVVVNGSSWVEGYRRQFAHVVAKDGFGEFVRRIKSKLRRR